MVHVHRLAGWHAHGIGVAHHAHRHAAGAVVEGVGGDDGVAVAGERRR